jgi:hypothetical protein
MSRVAAALAAFSLLGTPALAGGFHPIEARITPIAHFDRGDATQTKFGALTFLGGFTISSLDPGFGGWSGLDFAADGSLVAEADTGFWLRGRLTETNGVPTGIASPELGIMLGENGKPAPNKIATDAEGLRITTIDGVETALISFEQTPMIRAFRGPDFAAAVPTRIPLPGFVNHLPRNQGLESIAVAPADGPLAGAMVVLAERALDPSGNHRGFVLSGPKMGTFMIKRRDDFDLSDADFLPDGDLLILERKFSLIGGFGMRLRLIHAADIAPGKTVDGTVLVTADDRDDIDNMEGLAVRPGPNGETLLTLISDDNQSILQRTVLLQFALPPQTKTAP